MDHGWWTVPSSGWPEWSLRDVLASRLTARINQIGYLPHGLKRATWITDEPLAAEFAVLAAHGSTVHRGRTQPWPIRPEPTSGQSVDVLDFTGLTTPGNSYRLMIGDQYSHRFRIADDLYDTLATDALNLFYLLRSGCPIDEQRAPGYGRPAGHAGSTESRRHCRSRLDRTCGGAPIPRLSAVT
jgi:endoglucanase